MSMKTMTRRDLLGMGGAPLLQGENAVPVPSRLPPVDELVNVLEFEEAARIKLAPAVFATIGGGDRDFFDRMTLWPRVFVDSAPLNLTTEIFGEQMFAPILVGPIGQQQQFHQQGELATVQGASLAKTTVVISSRSSYPLEEISAASKTTLWYQVYLDRNASDVRHDIERGIKSGCRAICFTIGGSPPRSSQKASALRPDWRAIDRLRQGISVPVLLKGVMTPADARAALERGLQGIVVSNGGLTAVGPAPMSVLASIVDAVGAKVPVLIDGGFRRGTDVIKALALGARAVLLGRPPMWGLAAYGANGVQSVLKMLQNELARTMVNVGMPTIPSLDRSLVKIHGRASS